MKKDNVMFTIIGLLVGLIVGFMGANSINRSAMSQSASTAGPPSNSTSNPALPPDHPPIGTTGDEAAGSGPRPEVMAAIDKAKQRPQDFEAQMTAADLYYQIQRFDEAAKFYEAASKLKPTETEPMIKTGNAYFDKAETASENGNRQGSTPDFIQAEKWYLQALAKDPKNIDVRTDLGLSFFLREPRDIDRAIKEYKTSLSMQPNHEITLQNLALAYGEKGDKENQRATIEKLKTVNPKNPVITKTEN
jgi:tetratricopeptide (TPR) repeat protein